MQKQIVKIFFLLACFFLLPDFVWAENNLLQQSDLVYKGAFRMPQAMLIDYGRGVIAYRQPTEITPNGSLYIVGTSSSASEKIGEIGIPESLVDTSNVASLGYSTEIQSLKGSVSQWVSSDAHIGGLLIDQESNKLLGTQFGYYNASGSITDSHFTLDLNLNTFSGNYRIGNTTLGGKNTAGFVGGYMATIPMNWQESLDGKVITGLAGIPIISRTSYGPSIWSLDSSDLNGLDYGVARNANGLVYYEENHHDLIAGGWKYLNTDVSAHEYVTIADNFNGIAFPDGSKSVLVFGRHGYTDCYGPPVADIGTHGMPTGITDEYYCYDPLNIEEGGKGTHGAYPNPMRGFVWAYDANDLASVKAGNMNPWDIRPYATWELPAIKTLSWNGTSREFFIGGVAYDNVNQRLFISQRLIDGTYAKKPIVHVFQLNIPIDDTVMPSAPSGLSVM